MCDLTPLKGAQLSVRVEEALPDIIVVSYVQGTQIFRGVLLDATKRHLPCGIAQLNPAFAVGNVDNVGKPDEDVLYAVKQRYAYMELSPAGAGPQPTRSLKNNKIGKMTVRLRPRQVLCSKCKDICNENSESVTRKKKAADVEPATPTAMMVTTLPTVVSPAKRSANAPMTRSSHAILQVQQQQQLLTELQTQAQKKQPGALSGIVNKLNIVNNKRALSMSNQGNQNVTAAADVPPVVKQEEKDEKRLKRVILTRKKAGAQVEAEQANSSQPIAVANSGSNTNTRTIKICYGPQREGTVLKIPAAIESLKKPDTEDEDVPEENVVEEVVASKATRKAMKKAKKAKKKITFQTIGSPEQSTSRYNSASYSIGSSSPRYTVGSASPRHGLGNNSPRFVASLPPIPLAAFEPLPRRRKHKVKHKKKHKEDRDRKHKEEHDGNGREKEEEKCLTQKLSINLKRLSGTYTTSIVADATSTTSNAEYNDEANENAPQEDDENALVEKMEVDEEDSSEEVPDFPHGLLRWNLRNATSLNSALSSEGGLLIAGDIVWGKIQGFPWWPGKILTIMHCTNLPLPLADVSWYGSTRSTIIHCENLSPYLANFEARYNRKKRGAYRDAIKQACHEAHVLAELATSPSSTTATTSAAASPSRMIMLVQPALASPREINVIS